MNLLKPAPELQRGFKDKKWLGFVAQYGCQICEMAEKPQTTRSEIHHLAGIGAGKKASDLLTCMLCNSHHQSGEDAVHKGIVRFEDKFKTQIELIEEIAERINEDNDLKGKDLDHYLLIKEFCKKQK